MSQIHLTLSATYPDLQEPARNVEILNNLTETFPNTFRWAGEINVFKHALAGNGFFSRGNRVDIKHIEKGDLDPFFNK